MSSRLKLFAQQCIFETELLAEAFRKTRLHSTSGSARHRMSPTFRCWYKTHNPNRGSLDSHSYEAIILGFATNKKAYKLWDLSKGDVAVSQDVIFDENSAQTSATKDSVGIIIDEEERQRR